MTGRTNSGTTALECSGEPVKNETRYVELMIALEEDRTLCNVPPGCQERQLLGLEIVEYNGELLDICSRKDALRGKSTETSIESTSTPTPSSIVPERS